MSRWTPVLLAFSLVLVVAVPGRAQTASTSTSSALAADPLFTGVTLADSQQIAIAALRARYMGAAHLVIDSLLAAQTSLLSAQSSVAENGTDIPSRIDALRTELATLLAGERAAMRAMLTSAQQPTYDANVATDSARAAGGDQ